MSSGFPVYFLTLWFLRRFNRSGAGQWQSTFPWSSFKFSSAGHQRSRGINPSVSHMRASAATCLAWCCFATVMGSFKGAFSRFSLLMLILADRDPQREAFCCFNALMQSALICNRVLKKSRNSWPFNEPFWNRTMNAEIDFYLCNNNLILLC